MRQLTANEVEFEIECLPADMPVRGNAMASGDAEHDKKVEDEILADLENGNEWAWCTVRVVAKWEGFEGEDYLGGCSYESEEAFIADGCFEDMQDAALSDLNDKLAALSSKLCK